MAEIHRKAPLYGTHMGSFHAKPTTKSKLKKVAAQVAKGGVKVGTAVAKGGWAGLKWLKKTADNYEPHPGLVGDVDRTRRTTKRRKKR